MPVNYIKPESADTEEAARLARVFGLLEELQSVLKQFRFPEGSVMVRLYAQDCGEPNAYWSPADKSSALP